MGRSHGAPHQAKITELGETPLPKYIKREVEPEDEDRFQTIYAEVEGAVAAPTAGMHFSRQLLKRLELKGVEFAEMIAIIRLVTHALTRANRWSWPFWYRKSSQACETIGHKLSNRTGAQRSSLRGGALGRATCSLCGLSICLNVGIF